MSIAALLRFVAEVPVPVIEVWSARLDHRELPDLLRPLLSPDELERAARFRFDKDRHRYLVARGLLRVLLADYLQRDPAQLKFVFGAHGKPALQSDGASLEFNISHCGDAAVFAFSRATPVGVDVEWVRPLPELSELARRYFSDAEYDAIHAVEPARRAAAFFRCWTRKEAFIKALGEGLSHPLDSFSVTVDRDDDVAIEWAKQHPDAQSTWSLHHLNLAPDLVGAVAAPVANVTIQQRGDAGSAAYVTACRESNTFLPC